MVTALITSKGQITIPKVVRNSLGLNPGDRVAFEVRGQSEVVLRPLTKSVEEVFGRLSSLKISKKSVDDMNRAIGDRMRKRNK
ncbi:MAG: type II toxin-antitoxin system PrlF family antitoxin [Planctomycetes bacterium]|nr:type II toxin-antitoxin system PrlF family antitoxin [Planctomycetota bacterium]